MRRLAARALTKAPLAGAFLFVATAPAAGGIECPADRIDRRARVDFVYDGDTFRLADGTDVRLVAVNAPEIAHDEGTDERYSRAARRALRTLVERHKRRIHLRYAREREDDYGRLLAHAFLPDGRSVARWLLRRGYAARVTVPPNAWHHRCYARAERHARRRERRIWQLARYQGLAARSLTPRTSGFHVVTGRVTRVGESAAAWWLELDGLTLRLPKKNLHYFGDWHPGDAEGRRVHARGWIYRVDGRARMDLRHPAAAEWGQNVDAQ